MKIERRSDRAVMVHVGEGISTELVAKVAALAEVFQREMGASLKEVVPSYTGITLYCKNFVGSDTMQRISIICNAYSDTTGPTAGGKVHRIPVDYSGVDLDSISAFSGKSPKEIIQLHSSPVYTVGMMGFTPGFPYLIGLVKELHMPRRTRPRTAVPAGAVAIGGQQTGIYPHASPGGWHILGYTQFPLFDRHQDPPSVLSPGDKIIFEPWN